MVMLSLLWAVFELIEPQYLLGAFVGLLDRPPKMGVDSQFLDGPVIQSPAQLCAELVFSIFDEHPARFFGDTTFFDPFDRMYSCSKEPPGEWFFRAFWPRD
jgi:hypothetical protein